MSFFGIGQGPDAGGPYGPEEREYNTSSPDAVVCPQCGDVTGYVDAERIERIKDFGYGIVVCALCRSRLQVVYEEGFETWLL